MLGSNDPGTPCTEPTMHGSAWGLGGWSKRESFRSRFEGSQGVEDGGADRPEGNRTSKVQKFTSWSSYVKMHGVETQTQTTW